MFLINSRQAYFRCAPPSRSQAGRPYSEVTAAFLPSSLGISHSFALVFSTLLPVSVYDTAMFSLSLEVFLGSVLPGISLAVAADFFIAHNILTRICLSQLFTISTPIQLDAPGTTLRHSIALNIVLEY